MITGNLRYQIGAMSYRGRFVPTKAGRVFVHRAGRSAVEGASPLVMLHGYMMSHFIFRPILPQLTEQFDVIAIDLPGFGESDNPSVDEFSYSISAMAETVVEVLDSLSVRRANVMGHSFGGGVAASLAARHPERVDRLALIAATIFPVDYPSEYYLALLPGIGPQLFQYAFLKSHFRHEMRFRCVRSPESMQEDLIDYYWERFNRAGGRDAAHASLRALASLSNNTSDPGRVRAPTLLIWGDEDRVVPLSHGKRLRRAIPGAELAVVPACGHFPYLERTDEFLRQTLPFLEAPSSALSSASGQTPWQQHE